jgi:hypothetical protein
MRVSEIIRQVLDVIDQAEAQQAEQPVEDMGYSEQDIKRFRQIAGLTSTDKQYSTEPKEEYADIEAVTNNAGADGMNGTKDPADIRGEHPSLYPGTVHGAK